MSYNVDRTIDRGIRSPRHLSFLGEAGMNVLQPFMAHPLRPGETLAGMSFNINTWVRSIINLAQRPFIAAEVAYWVVPLTSLDSWFIDMIIGSPKSVMSQSIEPLASGTGARVADGPIGDQGHRTPGLQHKQRQWAGEIGADGGGSGSTYAPYVSMATWQVAQQWYTMNMINQSWEEPDLMDNPPPLNNYIRGAMRESFTFGTDSVDPDPSTEQQLSQLVEQLFLLSWEEKTYAEYLARHGVNPRDAAGVAQPVAIEHFNFTPMGSPQIIANFVPDSDGSPLSTFSNTQADETVEGQPLFAQPGSDFALLHDRGAYGMYGASRQGYRRRNLRIDEPSILLGTFAGWRESGAATAYSHIFDMSRMTHPGHWGDRGIGGVEEEDFLTVQDLNAIDNATPQAGEGADQTGQNHVFNFLNLYLHGEINNVGRNGNDDQGLLQFFARKPGGDSVNISNLDVNGHISTQLHILSDLVG
uniref:hypothetical protein n=1 Tax=Roseivirga sp. TaxID=1964215 RepID=UPI004047E1F6